MSAEDVEIGWRLPVADAEIVELTRAHGGEAVPGWWDRVSRHSLGWVVARDQSGLLVGFVNVAWDGGDHAFLIDTKTRPSHQHRGLGTAVVRCAVDHARAAGCEWLFVDFEPQLEAFYLESCGFRATPAGLVHLPDAELRGGVAVAVDCTRVLPTNLGSGNFAARRRLTEISHACH